MNPRLRLAAALSAPCLGLAALGYAYAGVSSGPGMNTNAANAKLPDARNNLELVRSLTDFGAKCDGASDDAAAFAAATAWLKTAANRTVMMPAGICATSQTLTLGDGRQLSTTLSAPLSGGETSIPVASTSGIQNGDRLVVVNNAGSVVDLTVNGTPSGGSVPISGTYTGGAASAGNTVYAGKESSSHGGQLVGYGLGQINLNLPNNGCISTIKYTGPAAGATTLAAGAASGATTIQVASAVTIAIGTPLRIQLDSGVTFWTHASETPTGTTVKLAINLPGAAALGNTVTIANTAVLRVNGPVIGAQVRDLCLDANNLAAIGLDTVHSNRGRYRVTAYRYTGIGHLLRAGESYLGMSFGSGENEYELFTANPQNNRTIGCWARGSSARNVAHSRNRYVSPLCYMGGADSAAAGLRVEFADNNTFLKPYTSRNGADTSGCGLWRQPSLNYAGFPVENTYISPAFIGGVCDGSATGGTLGDEYAPGYASSDAEPIPTSATFAGTLPSGLPFGKGTPRDNFGGLKLSRASSTQLSVAPGTVTDATGHTMLRLNSTCTLALTTSGDKGLDGASLRQANTWYAVFVVGNYIGGNASCMIAQTSAAAVPALVLPASPAFQFSAYVGRFKTDAAQTIPASNPLILPRGHFYIDASDTYTPGGSGFRPREVRMLACGGGGSGGSGARQASGTAASGGVGGSAGGCMEIHYAYEQLPSTIAVTVGAGGATVSPPGADSTAGSPGNAGSPTYFGPSAAAAWAYGGAGCAGDGGRLNASAASGGSGGGVPNTGNGAAACTNGAAGSGGSGMTGAQAGSNSGAPGQTTANGVGSAGGASTTASSFTGGTAVGRFACAGGGSGGGITAAPASINGTSGGYAADANVSRGTGGTSGTPNGGAGTNSTLPFLPGTSGGGGYGNASGNAGNGGAAGQCAGGGGGGTAINGSTAGSGGAGGSGYAFVWELR